MSRLAPLLMLRDLLLLRPDPLRHLAGTWRTARRSFRLWLIALPAMVAATYIAERPFIAYFHVPLDLFVLLRLLALIVGLQAGYLFAYVVSRFENLQGGFARLVESQNWMILASALLGFALNFSTRNTAFAKDDIVQMAVAQYVVGLFYIWLAVWRALGGNPFYATGITVALIMPPALCSDIAGTLMFGQPRPFFDPSIPTILPNHLP